MTSATQSDLKLDLSQLLIATAGALLLGVLYLALRDFLRLDPPWLVLVIEAVPAGATASLGAAVAPHAAFHSSTRTYHRVVDRGSGGTPCFLLAEQLCHVDALHESIARLSHEIAQRLRPFAAEVTRLQTIPRVGRRAAEVLLAEVGADMSRFPDARHLPS